MMKKLKELFKKKPKPKGFISSDKDYLREGANSKYHASNARKAIQIEDEE